MGGNFFWSRFYVAIIFLQACTGDTSRISSDQTRWQKTTMGTYLSQMGGIVMEVDPEEGGRIITMSIDGYNLLTGSEIDSINFGSTLWLSPQNLWRWPPPASLDRAPYQILAKSDTLYLQSQTDTRFGVSFTKQFIAIPADTVFSMVYAIRNHTDSVQQYALWEVSRMHKDSKVIFALEERNSLRTIKDWTWLEEDGLLYSNIAATDTLTNKMYANSSGWLIYQKDSLALIKRFPDLTLEQLPPTHNEVEVYIDDTSYLEIEQHSPYRKLEAGETYTWEVKWYPRKVRSDAVLKKWINKLENEIN
jgi:hypothetical protein